MAMAGTSSGENHSSPRKHGGPERQPARLELGVEPRHAAFELAALDPDAEVTDAPAEELLVAQRHPGGIHSGRW